MKSPSRDHYQLQTICKIGFASYIHLRFLLSTFILLGLVLHPTSWVSAYEGKATLVIKGSGVCKMHGRIDRHKSETKITLQLPKEDGPIKGKGTWSQSGSGYGHSYTGGGAVVLKGQLRNGFLIFPWPDYYLDGILQGKPAEVVSPIRLKAKAGSELVQPYPFKGCEGRIVYRLEMPSERWEVLVNGGERITYGNGETVAGLKIKWRMRMEIEIENGKYKSGTGIVTTQGLDSYSHPPGFWTCRPLSGRYPWGKYKFESNTFTYPIFDVEGSMSGRAVVLSLPENKYFIAWECYFNELEAEEFFRNKGGQRVEDRVRGLRQDTMDSELVPLPESISAVLKDGWSSPKVNMNAASWQRIHVKRIK